MPPLAAFVVLCGVRCCWRRRGGDLVGQLYAIQLGSTIILGHGGRVHTLLAGFQTDPIGERASTKIACKFEGYS